MNHYPRNAAFPTPLELEQHRAAAQRRVALRRAIRATGRVGDIDLELMHEQGLLNLATILGITEVPPYKHGD